MSEENVEAIQNAFQAFDRGDPEGFFDALADDIEWRVRPDLPDAETYRGHDGVVKLLARFNDVVDDIWIKPEEFIPAGEDRVVVPIRWGGRGKGSGIDFEERRETWNFTIRGGKIAHIEEFATREQALKAAGLSE
jgi:ketosteroid isomerase-like protein